MCLRSHDDDDKDKLKWVEAEVCSVCGLKVTKEVEEGCGVDVYEGWRVGVGAGYI